MDKEFYQFSKVIEVNNNENISFLADNKEIEIKINDK